MEQIVDIKKSRNQFLLLGVLPICIALFLGKSAGFHQIVNVLIAALWISYWVMIGRFSKSLGYNTWQSLGIVALNILYPAIAIILITIALLLGKSIESVKSKTNKSSLKPTEIQSTLQGKLAASREAKKDLQG